MPEEIAMGQIQQILVALERIQEDGQHTRSEITAIRQDIADIQQDIPAIRQDIADIQQDIPTIRQDIARLDRRMGSMTEARVRDFVKRQFGGKSCRAFL